MKWTDAQNDAINSRERNLLVSAGAGCGKTAILTNRIMRIMLEEKADIDRFMIATFTNAAAASMKEKIRKLLYSEMNKASKSDEDRKFLFRQISRLENASISTIHSFCIRLIREYYHVIDVDPSFRIIDETNAKLLMDEAFDMLFEDRYLNNDTAFIDTSLAYSFEKDEETFREILSDIYNFIYNRPNPFGWLEEKTEVFKNGSEIEKSEQFGLLEEIVMKYVSLAVKNSEKTLELAREEGVKGKSIINLENDVSNLRALEKNVKKDIFYVTGLTVKDLFKGAMTTSHFPDKALRDTVADMRKTSTELIKSTQSLLSFSKEDTFGIIKGLSKHIEVIKKALYDFDEIFKNLKDENGVLEFRDLEHLALRILSDEKALGEIHETYRYIFVDEYQDTNLVQEAIIEKLSGENSLFTVGDVKQSIYRFRQADPDIFVERLDGYEAGKLDGKCIYMNTNFRTNTNVLDGINYLFERLMSRDIGKIDYDENESLIAGREEKSGPKTEFHLVIGTADREIEYIASLINELIREDIFDAELGKRRKMKYSDICILARSANPKISDFKSAFGRYSIPINSESETGYFNTVEIEMMKNLLSVINNMSDDISLLSVMRSPLFGFTEDELVELRLFERHSSFKRCVEKYAKSDSADEQLKAKVNEMLSFIDDYRNRAKYMSVSELIQEIYRKTGITEYIKALPFGNIRANNLSSLVQKANEYESFSNNGLYGFIGFLEYSKAKNEAGISVSQTDDSVKYMSIHKSKGLEFPVVILYGCYKNFNEKDMTKPFILNKDIGISPLLVDINSGFSADSFLRKLAKMYERRETVSEEMRLLYVAATRAKEKLIFTGNYSYNEKYLDKKTGVLTKSKVASSKNYMEWITDAILAGRNKLLTDGEIRFEDDLFMIKQTDLREENSLPSFTVAKSRKKADADLLSEEERKSIDSRLSFTYEKEIDTRIPRSVGVSAIKNIDLIEVGKNVISYKQKPSFALEESEMSAAQKGSLIHYLLEMTDLDALRDAEDVESEAAKQIDSLLKKGYVTKAELEQVDTSAVARFYTGPIGKAVLQSRNVLREKPFSLELDAGLLRKEWKNSTETVMVKGIMDLAYEDENGDIVIVDYKTSVYHDEKRKKELTAEYAVQLDYYRKAVETLLDRKVSHAYVYFLLYNEAVEV